MTYTSDYGVSLVFQINLSQVTITVPWYTDRNRFALEQQEHRASVIPKALIYRCVAVSVSIFPFQK